MNAFLSQRKTAIRALQSAHVRNDNAALNKWIVRVLAVIALAAILIVGSIA